MKTIYLHIGAPKTGTSTIQHFCRKNRNVLVERGVWFAPKPRVHHTIVHSLIGANNAPPHLFDSVLSEFEASPCSSMLISAESFYARARQITPSMLPATLDGFRLAILCYVRRSDDFITSLYQTNVRGKPRFAGSITQFMNQRSQNYAARLSRFVELFKPQSVIVRSYDETKHDLLGDFLSAIIGTADEELRAQFPTTQMNARLSSRQILFLRQLNVNGTNQNCFKQVLRAFRAVGDNDTRPLLGLAQRQVLVAEFNAEVEELNRRFGSNIAPVPFPEDNVVPLTTLSPEESASLWSTVSKLGNGCGRSAQGGC
jgi:hypothetical protein